MHRGERRERVSARTSAPRERREASRGQTASALEGGALRWRLKFAEDDVPIAERFRRAYLEVDAERAARREKNSQKRKNRNLNRMFTSSSERHIYRALDDLSLVDRY